MDFLHLPDNRPSSPEGFKRLVRTPIFSRRLEASPQQDPVGVRLPYKIRTLDSSPPPGHPA